MSKYLIEENPLILLPTLAKEIGLHEAIILQQLHYWIEHRGPDGRKYGQVVDGLRWIRNTAKNWMEGSFPFFSEAQVYRALKNLEDTKLILSRSDLNKIGYDRTKWYTIDYPILRQREMDFTPVQVPYDASVDTIPETTTETTTEIKPNPTLKKSKVKTAPEPWQLKRRADQKAIVDALAKHFLVTIRWGANFDRKFLDWALDEVHMTPEQIEYAVDYWQEQKWLKSPGHPGIALIQRDWLLSIEGYNSNPSQDDESDYDMTITG